MVACGGRKVRRKVRWSRCCWDCCLRRRGYYASGVMLRMLVTTGKCVLVGVGDRSCCTERREMDRSSLVSLEREDGRTDRGRRKTGEKTDAAGLCEKNARSFYVIFFSLLSSLFSVCSSVFFFYSPVSCVFFSSSLFSCSLLPFFHVEIPLPFMFFTVPLSSQQKTRRSCPLMQQIDSHFLRRIRRIDLWRKIRQDHG